MLIEPRIARKITVLPGHWAGSVGPAPRELFHYLEKNQVTCEYTLLEPNTFDSLVS